MFLPIQYVSIFLTFQCAVCCEQLMSFFGRLYECFYYNSLSSSSVTLTPALLRYKVLPPAQAMQVRVSFLRDSPPMLYALKCICKRISCSEFQRGLFLRLLSLEPLFYRLGETPVEHKPESAYQHIKPKKD